MYWLNAVDLMVDLILRIYHSEQKQDDFNVHFVFYIKYESSYASFTYMSTKYSIFI